jgi:hypothetical protein
VIRGCAFSPERGDADGALLLACDHLADHPDSLLVADIAAASARR